MEGRADLVREVMRGCVPGALFACFVGLFINLLYLVQPFFSHQVYDRVLGSGSLDTLAGLVVLAATGLLFLAILDYVRARTFMITGARLARRLSTPVLDAAVGEVLRRASTSASNAMRDLQDVRQFVSSGQLSLPIDMAFAPLFLAALMLLHPVYALVAGVGSALMLGMGLLTEVVARRPAAAASESALRSQAEVAAAIRNAELIEAMGMRTAIVRRWSFGQTRTLALIAASGQAAKAIAAASRSVRARCSCRWASPARRSTRWDRSCSASGVRRTLCSASGSHASRSTRRRRDRVGDHTPNTRIDASFWRQSSRLRFV